MYVFILRYGRINSYFRTDFQNNVVLDFENVQHVISLVSPEDTPKIPSRYKIRYWMLPDPTWDPKEEQEDSFRALYEELERRISNFFRSENIDI